MTETADDSLVAVPAGELRRRAAGVALLVLDVDGVLTDGTIYYGADGETLKAFNIMDGLGLRLLARSGIATAIISARTSPPLLRRAEDLGIDHVYTGRHDKEAAWDELLADTGTGPEAAAFVGDDLIDLGLLRRAGLAVAVCNGHPAVRQRAHYVTLRSGGHGAVREVAELLLASRGALEPLIRDHAAR
ncbi:HAD hydrolase family protein [Aquisalimonas lutea]|uniref:KdsC family phosphatase n=1 Tax=Aquisalimonas lutea TaxID=1327750 RepID=UPI0025B35638|nr:HAD hydrolase family protein [Aquisalimonas lutea]MDN3517380.1 HAD hydrolase family protein [Aquisalimonas lutea]